MTKGNELSHDDRYGLQAVFSRHYADCLHRSRSRSGDEPQVLVEPGRDVLHRRLSKASFREIQIDEVTFTRTYATFDRYWEITRELAAPVANVLETLGDDETAAVRDAVQEALGQFASETGALSIPAAAVVARAVA